MGQIGARCRLFRNCCIENFPWILIYYCTIFKGFITGKERQGVCTVGEMVQNSQTLYSFTFTAVLVIHEYIYSHSTTMFTFKKYICLHLTTYFLFTNIFTHIYGPSFVCHLRSEKSGSWDLKIRKGSAQNMLNG